MIEMELVIKILWSMACAVEQNMQHKVMESEQDMMNYDGIGCEVDMKIDLKERHYIRHNIPSIGTDIVQKDEGNLLKRLIHSKVVLYFISNRAVVDHKSFLESIVNSEK